MTSQQPRREIAGYRIESLIGRGGMAVVYRAEDMRLGRKVALKLLAPQLADDEQFRKRFIRESRLAASLDHPNIIPIYEAGEADGQLFIAMRYVPGRDLKALLTEEHGRLPVGRTVSLLAQVGDALDSAHRAGLVHRDVKPANIMVVPGQERSGHAQRDHVYLTDFGLTKRTSELSGGLTGTGHFLGTVDYVSPEQIQGKPIGPATDIYALGCVLYQCLTGRLPFHRDDDAAMLWAHLAETPPTVTALRSDVPPAVDGVVAHAMAKDPADRYASCAELVAELEQALGVPASESAPERRPTAEGHGVAGGPSSSESSAAVAGLAGLAGLAGAGGPGTPRTPGTPAAPEGPEGPAEPAAPVPAGSSGRHRRPTLRVAGLAAAALAALAAVLLVFVFGFHGTPAPSSTAAAGAPATRTSAAPAATPAPTPTPTSTPTPSLRPAAAVGVFAGLTKNSGIGLSFALDGGKAVAYVCDGRTYEIWLQGAVNGDQVTMSGPGNASLTGVANGQALSGRITTPGGRIDFLAQQAAAPAGVYKAEIQINGRDAYLGWAVLPDGTQLGAINSGQGVTPAPSLTIDTSTTPPTATFALNGKSYRAEVARAGQSLWPEENEPSPTR
jgi:tRNA A-37 threonylcarbamoyl transferase component Bud32